MHRVVSISNKAFKYTNNSVLKGFAGNGESSDIFTPYARSYALEAARISDPKDE